MSDDGGEHVADQYDDANRAFLQSFMARGTLTLKEGQELLAAIFRVQEGRPNAAKDVTQADLNSYLSAAAEAISPFDYEIRSIENQIDKTRVWALVNSVSDPITQMATTRTTEEVLYIRRFLNAMFETYNTKNREIMAVSSMQALEGKLRKGARPDGASTQAEDKGLTGDQVEKLLAKLVEEKWIEKSSAGFYRLAPRALMELRSWLLDTYNNPDEPEDWQRIKCCEACKEIVTIGQRCSNMECNVRLHNICEAAYWNSRQPSHDCPTCGTLWDGKRFVGQKVVTSTEDYLRGKRRSGGVNKRARAPEDEEDQEQESVVNANRRRRNGGNKRARTPEEQDEEEEEESETNGNQRRRGRVQEKPNNGRKMQSTQEELARQEESNEGPGPDEDAEEEDNEEEG